MFQGLLIKLHWNDGEEVNCLQDDSFNPVECNREQGPGNPTNTIMLFLLGVICIEVQRQGLLSHLHKACKQETGNLSGTKKGHWTYKVAKTKTCPHEHRPNH